MWELFREKLDELFQETLTAVNAAEQLHHFARPSGESVLRRQLTLVAAAFERAKSLVDDDITPWLLLARTPPRSLPNVPDEPTTHQAALRLVKLQCAAHIPTSTDGIQDPSPEPIPAASWAALKYRLREEYLAALQLLNETEAGQERHQFVPPPPSDSSRPKWRSDVLVFTVRGKEKRYKKNAENQIKLLTAFESADWKEHLSNLTVGENLNATVRDLNDSLERAGVPIRFKMDGFGSVKWHLLPDENPNSHECP